MTGGIGFTGMLTILFIALKLTHVISWAWWLVLSPLWIAALITIAIIVIVALGVAIQAEKPVRKKSNAYRTGR